MRRLSAKARLLLTLVIVALVAPPSSSAADPKTGAFPPGVWSGKAFYGGTLDRPGLFGFANAIVDFQLTVDGDTVVDGVMHVTGHGESSTAAGAGDMYFTGTLYLSGSASDVLAKGDVEFTGTADGYPIQFGGPVSFIFSATFASCTRVFGDLTDKAVGASIPDVAVSAPFVAFREKYGSQYEDLLNSYQVLVGLLINMISHQNEYTVEDLLDAAKQAEDLNASILELVPCVPQPGGLKGTQVSEFQSLFRQLLTGVMQHADEMSVTVILELLSAGVRIGALVGSSDEVTALLDVFDDALTVKLVAAIDAKDVATVKDILIGAKQAGLTELAEDAEAGLKGILFGA